MIGHALAGLLAPYAVTPMESTILRLFLRKDARTAAELSAELSVSPSRISREVAKLAGKGLVRRRRLRSDRRVVQLTLSEEGRSLTVEIDERLQAYEAKLSEGVSEEEMAVFTSVTSKVMANYAALGEVVLLTADRVNGNGSGPFGLEAGAGEGPEQAGWEDGASIGTEETRFYHQPLPNDSPRPNGGAER